MLPSKPLKPIEKHELETMVCITIPNHGDNRPTSKLGCVAVANRKVGFAEKIAKKENLLGKGR